MLVSLRHKEDKNKTNNKQVTQQEKAHDSPQDQGTVLQQTYCLRQRGCGQYQESL